MIEASAQLRRELAYCVPLGIAHSVFLGWDEDDQDKALLWTERERERCRKCGTRLAEWEADRHAHVAHDYRCPGCEILDQAEEQSASVPAHQRRGVHTALVPRRLAQALAAQEDANR